MPDPVQHGCSNESFHAFCYRFTSSPIRALQTSVHTQSYQANEDGTNWQLLPYWALPLNPLQSEFTPSGHFPSLSKQSSDNINSPPEIWDEYDPLPSKSLLFSNSSVTQPTFLRNKEKKGSVWDPSRRKHRVATSLAALWYRKKEMEMLPQEKCLKKKILMETEQKDIHFFNIILLGQNVLKVLILFPFELKRSAGIGLAENRIQPNAGRIQSHPVYRYIYISCIISWLPKCPFAGYPLIPCFSMTFLTKCSRILTLCSCNVQL